MGGSKPKPSGAKPVRWSTRPKKQFKDLRPFLYSGPRARIDRYKPSNISGGGVQAGVAAASVEVDVGLSPGNAADWAAANLPDHIGHIFAYRVRSRRTTRPRRYVRGWPP